MHAGGHRSAARQSSTTAGPHLTHATAPAPSCHPGPVHPRHCATPSSATSLRKLPQDSAVPANPVATNTDAADADVWRRNAMADAADGTCTAAELQRLQEQRLWQLQREQLQELQRQQQLQQLQQQEQLYGVPWQNTQGGGIVAEIAAAAAAAQQQQQQPTATPEAVAQMAEAGNGANLVSFASMGSGDWGLDEGEDEIGTDEDTSPDDEVVQFERALAYAKARRAQSLAISRASSNGSGNGNGSDRGGSAGGSFSWGGSVGGAAGLRGRMGAEPEEFGRLLQRAEALLLRHAAETASEQGELTSSQPWGGTTGLGRGLGSVGAATAANSSSAASLTASTAYPSAAPGQARVNPMSSSPSLTGTSLGIAAYRSTQQEHEQAAAPDAASQPSTLTSAVSDASQPPPPPAPLMYEASTFTIRLMDGVCPASLPCLPHERYRFVDPDDRPLCSPLPDPFSPSFHPVAPATSSAAPASSPSTSAAVSDVSPVAILLRGHQLSLDEVPPTVCCIARCGPGAFTNVPLGHMTELGIPVFNTPGANANAVKELVVCALIMAARGVMEAAATVPRIYEEEQYDYKRIVRRFDKFRSRRTFRGSEIEGKTLGVIGLGAVGSRVVSAALALGMNVVGFDPWISAEAAWRLPGDKMARAERLEDLLMDADFVSVHVPYFNRATHHMLNADNLQMCKRGVHLINFSPAEVVDGAAVRAMFDSGRLTGRYIADFADPYLQGHPRHLVLPHLGACTREAEDKAAAMAAAEVKEFLETGNVRHSVNFPSPVTLRRKPLHDGPRLCITVHNEPGVLESVAFFLASRLGTVPLSTESGSLESYDVPPDIPTPPTHHYPFTLCADATCPPSLPPLSPGPCSPTPAPSEGVLGSIATFLGSRSVNIEQEVTGSRGSLAYIMLDIGGDVPDPVQLQVDLARECPGLINSRMIGRVAGPTGQATPHTLYNINLDSWPTVDTFETWEYRARGGSVSTVPWSLDGDGEGAGVGTGPATVTRGAVPRAAMTLAEQGIDSESDSD